MVEEYTADEELFFKDFSKAFSKLISLGAPKHPAVAGGRGLLQSILSFLGLGGN